MYMCVYIVYIYICIYSIYMYIYIYISKPIKKQTVSVDLCVCLTVRHVLRISKTVRVKTNLKIRTPLNQPLWSCL